MKFTRKTASLPVLAATLLCCFASSTFAHIEFSVAGPNGTEPGSGFQVPWTYTADPETNPEEGHWVLNDPNDPIILIADPEAAPMAKSFMTPRNLTGPGRDTFLHLQPDWTAPVWEYFIVSTGDELTAFLPLSPAITDWHEHIQEPGWEWVVPPPESTDPALITADGLPWDWEFIDAGSDPSSLSVEFAPIEPGVVIGIHKQLVWRGTPENSVWGDRMLDDGSDYPEHRIEVWEYPTIAPEPSTLALTTLGLFGLCCRRRKRIKPNSLVQPHP